MNKTILIIITMVLAIGIGIIFWQSQNTTDVIDDHSIQNVEIRDGVQYVIIHARGGYSPKVSIADANIPTKLIIKTNGTYDCSSSLVIHSIGYQTILPHTGETEIDIGTQKVGEIVRGVCSMGMFSFQIQFS